MFSRLSSSASASKISWPPSWVSRTTIRNYAILVKEPNPLPGKTYPRVFSGKKLFQYKWYTRILQETRDGSPLIFLHHDSFSANRLKKLRNDIGAAARKHHATQQKASLDAPRPITETDLPTLTVIRTGVFGAALRAQEGVSLSDIDTMLNNTPGNYAVLQLPTLDPPYLSAVLRAMDRTVPPRPPKTPEELAKELAARNADPETPGRRVKRQRAQLTPDLKVMGALLEGKVFLPQGVKDVSALPRLDTLRAQIIGLLSAPGAQLAGVLSQAAGGQLARTLEGLKKSLEEEQNGTTADP
ncbi:hypothetical protein E1B28_001674 [Marasmius oreades]|uniref:Mitochondrial ribosomal protein L10 n=1 Tax=Marasmius oreades TaxID=181124 RepID=A0A9P7V433_9AGAR|nr:uncharacterized protein E1B28_001674 [Marasmius oreades]KAG7099871.1 hypothetical protein E1B28_001674 [Marasmius oreades]